MYGHRQYFYFDVREFEDTPSCTSHPANSGVPIPHQWQQRCYIGVHARTGGCAPAGCGFGMCKQDPRVFVGRVSGVLCSGTMGAGGLPLARCRFGATWCARWGPVTCLQPAPHARRLNFHFLTRRTHAPVSRVSTLLPWPATWFNRGRSGHASACVACARAGLIACSLTHREVVYLLGCGVKVLRVGRGFRGFVELFVCATQEQPH